jgi:hypothetical protein
LPPAKEILAYPNSHSERHSTVEYNRFLATDDLEIHGTQNLKSAEPRSLARALENVLVDVFVFVRHISGSSPCFTKIQPNG